MNEFLFWQRNPLVPHISHEVASLHPASFQSEFPTLTTSFCVDSTACTSNSALSSDWSLIFCHGNQSVQT